MQTHHLPTALILALTGCPHGPAPEQLPAAPPTHCLEDEQVLFSCPIQSGEIMSLCGSADLGSGPGEGTLQFRFGFESQAEDAVPFLPMRPDFFSYEKISTGRSRGEVVSFWDRPRQMSLHSMSGSSHPGEAEADPFHGLRVHRARKLQIELTCVGGPVVHLARLADWRPRPHPKPIGLTGLRISPDQEPVPIYDGPGGKRLGMLEVIHPGQGWVDQMLVRDDSGAPIAVESMRGTREASYEVRNLEFYAQRDGFSQVLPHAGKNGLWVRDADLGDAAPAPWAEYLAGLTEVLWKEDLEGLQIHRSPSSESTAQTLGAGVYRLEPTGRHEGGWLEVRIKAYNRDFHCEEGGRPTGRRWSGWIRGADSEGEPSVWHYTRGC